MKTIPHILIVEDEPNIGVVLENLLQRDGYEVAVAANGEIALELLSTRTFDLAILDLNLGQGMSGLDILVTVRQRFPDTVVIMLTGYATLESAIEAVRLGAHEYLLKPCRADQISASVRQGLLKREKELGKYHLLRQLEEKLTYSLEEIRAVIQEPTAAPTRTEAATTAAADTPAIGQFHQGAEARFLQRGGLMIDMVRRIVTFDGRVLDLTLLEYGFLAYLVREAPRVVPAQELVRQIHGYDCDPAEASDMVRPHIYRLRQKLNAIREQSSLIRTVRGVGYSIN